MKNRLITLVILTIVCVFTLFSCSAGGNAGEGNNGDVAIDNLIFNSETDLTIVFDDALSAEQRVDIENILLLKAKSVEIKDSSFKPAEHEIIFGRTNRDLSKKAYRTLELRESEEDYVGYCIASDGSSVAIAFDDAIYGQKIAEEAAYDMFVEKYLSGDALVVPEGIYNHVEFDAFKYQEEKDLKELEKRWADVSDSLTEKFGAEAAASMVKSLREFQAIYSDDLVDWFANLYDPVIGGFYYSNSARNSEGYLPDLESTAQALGFLTASGITNKMSDFIPEDMQQQIVAFVKSLQNPVNGHFYHPQWGKEFTDKYPARLGRDLGNATRLLSYFGAIPTYDTPNGVKGENPRGTAPASLTEKLSASSSVIAISKVIATSEAGVEDWLLNEENFRNFLKKYDSKIKNDAYWVGNELESVATQIVARDKVLKERGEKYSLCEIAVEWFASHLDPETGLWEPYENNEYDCVNGILKCSSAISKMGYPVPGALNLMEYAMQAITSEADPHHVCCVLNTWYALTVLTSNILTYSSTGEADIEAFRAKYMDTYPELVNATRDKFALFIKGPGTSSGAFSYFQTHTSPGSQGMPVALENTNEGDVNSSYICSAGVSGHVWTFIGESAIPLYTTVDGMRFLKIIESLGEIVKESEIEPIPITFDDLDGNYDLLKGNNILDYWLPGGELAIEEGTPFNEKSSVLRFTTRNGNADEVHFRLTKSQGSYNAVAYQSDMMINPEANTTYKLLFFTNDSKIRAAEMSLIAKPGDGIYVSVIDTDKTVKLAECEEWFTFRVEYARLSYSKILLDIYVNNKLVATSSVPYGAESISANSVTRVRFATDSAGVGDMYLDNLFVEQTLKKLPAGAEEDTGPSEAETGIITFEPKPLGAYKNQGWLDWWLPGGTLEIVDAEPYGNESKALALKTSGKDDDLFQLFVTKNEQEFNAVGVETDIMFDVSDGSRFKVLIYGGPKGYEMTMSVEDGGVYVFGAGMEKTKVGNAKEWFKLQFGYAKLSGSAMYFAVIVDDEVVAESNVPYAADQIPAVAEIRRIQFSADKSTVSEGTVYFDNSIMAQLVYDLPDAPAEPEDPDEPEVDPDEPIVPPENVDPTVETYDQGDALDTFRWNNWIDGEIGGSIFEIETGKPYGVASKVYHYRTISGYKPEATFMFNSNTEANLVSYKTDMMFTTEGYLRPEFQFRTGDNQLLYKFYIETNAGTVKLLDTDLTLIATLAEDGEWFNFCVKYYRDTDNQIKIAFYLNGNRVGNKVITASGAVNTVGRVRFWTETTHTGDFYFDNTQILSVKVASDELPTDSEIPKEPEKPVEPTPTPTPTPDGDSPFKDEDNVADKEWT